jgi:hypothetical protein
MEKSKKDLVSTCFTSILAIVHCYLFILRTEGRPPLDKQHNNVEGGRSYMHVWVSYKVSNVECIFNLIHTAPLRFSIYLVLYRVVPIVSDPVQTMHDGTDMLQM